MIEYKIVEGTKEEVQREMNNLVKQGWSNYGNINMVTHDGALIYSVLMGCVTDKI